MNNSLDVRDNNELAQAFINAENILTKDYLQVLNQLEIEEINEDLKEINIEENARFFKLNKLVYNKNEDNLDKLCSVVNAVALSKGTVVTIIKSNGKKVDYYLGVINKNFNGDVVAQYETLERAFKGNFIGSDISSLSNRQLRNLNNDIFLNNYDFEESVITSVSGIAALRLSEGKDILNYIQGLEKFTDAMEGKAYTALLLADPVSNEEVVKAKLGYENLYSEMVPFLKTELSFNESDSITLTEGTTTSITKTINESIGYTQNTSETDGWSSSESFGKSKSKNKGAILGIVGAVGGLAFGGASGIIAGSMVGNVLGSLMGSASDSENITAGRNKSISKSFGESKQQGKSEAESTQESNSSSEATTRGRNIQISYENRGVRSLLEKIDMQISRLDRCNDFGSFNFAAYFISNDPSVNKIAASSYNALMKGENSSVESSVINTWSDKSSNKSLNLYLNKFTHPSFKFNLSKNKHIKVTPASIVSGKELAIHMSLPKKSINGLPVVESTEFGRNIFKLSNEKSLEYINLGNIYHMGAEEDTKVKLDKESLAMHTFITGSTGTGKSNTIYNILNELTKERINFLVIEPVKGEYKHVFGYRKDVTVWGTNNKYTKLLKINPFKFPEDVHVLEHIDRLIEILNVCWPMYAAMPAVLKESIEKAYESVGWDLDISENKYDKNLFPNFNDVLIKLNEVINESAFSEELKGNYIGALVTRVKSLTNGINGRIFAIDEIDNSLLFDSNVIVDLSRIGSSETKSMIMGILVMRLSEHRMSQGGINNKLKHITVLEEAHNILKRTSIEQSMESSNLVGKSVEMISNAIAEMRTYGEGFIIVDQSPNMVDMSTIRNTNTKIILRLPDFLDRNLVGKAAALNEEQIVELAKLETGVGAIYQNNWLEPVLCKVSKFEGKEIEFKEEEELKDTSNNLNIKITKILLQHQIGESIDYNKEALINEIINSKYPNNIKVDIINVLKNKNIYELELKDVSNIISKIYYNQQAFEKAKNCENFKQWTKIVLDNMGRNIMELDKDYRDAILQCILREQALADKDVEQFYFNWTEYMRGEVI
ncbi:ATP-binding protein [Clostridium tarantellae]|uniref:DUF87 domain-containing protein n=1 Tax=Clostridium tarantellae TaxID=39493 RepID=A0A6I1MKL0_9CLOT|nr:ATP-binding protein [Clostridium tarantellae]MPQ43550.1 DUF87 domain-containing protein [Clostridium tarantellae]